VFQTTRGFSNWKDGTVGFKRHEQSACHRDAISVVVTIPSSTKDVGEQLSVQHAQMKVQNRDALFQIISSIRFLRRQGLALRGDGAEVDSNFCQLLYMKARENPAFADWLKRKTDVYVAPEIQNEVIRVMAHTVLRDIISELHASTFICLMVDETMDKSNKEQTVVVLRRVTNDLAVYDCAAH